MIDELEKNDSDKDTSTETSRVNSEFLVETDKSTLMAYKTYLSRNSSDWNEVCEKWKLTFKMRQQDLNEMGSIDFFNPWPKISDSRAPALVSDCVVVFCFIFFLYYKLFQIKIDFDILYPSKAQLLYSKWEDFKVKLILYYENHIRNDFCRQQFSNAKLTENKGKTQY